MKWQQSVENDHHLGLLLGRVVRLLELQAEDEGAVDLAHFGLCSSARPHPLSNLVGNGLHDSSDGDFEDLCD